MNKSPLKAAITMGISTFVGFSLIFPLMISTTSPSNWGFALLYLFYFIISGQMIIGLILSFLIGLISYLIFRLLFKREISKKQLAWITFSGSGVALIIGFLAFFPVKKSIMEGNSGKEIVGTVDTNNDGKPDKWVHDDIYGKVLEIDYDTNFDGKPDVREYYKNGKVYKKEVNTDFDGRVDKVEGYK